MKEQKTGGYLEYFPITRKIRQQLDQDVKKMGFQQTASKLIGIVGRDKFIVKKDDETKEVLGNKSAIVIANHPSYAEIIAVIASLEPREDIHLVGISNFLGIGPSFSEYIIPIYMTRQMEAKRHKFPVKLGNTLKFGPRMPCEFAHQRNIESIETAIEKIDNGGLVVIFPEGVQVGKDKKWLNGLGHLVSGIREKDDVNLVFAYVKGTSGWDCMRVLPVIKNALPKMEVVFSRPQSASQVIGKEAIDPKLITRKIEGNYKKYVDSVV